ncbi:hypothetical protein QTO34_004873 [Cnephaeus nilssonii]|uniref:Uncharacterized protein n=1 Tax=Cnephaeus nilssonii TaxID=3371016 RepID=A0AA40HQ70_CNENI|nr:hypothetical protein QTO34_004873 [Eptesicus nilssonii]
MVIYSCSVSLAPVYKVPPSAVCPQEADFQKLVLLCHLQLDRGQVPTQRAQLSIARFRGDSACLGWWFKVKATGTLLQQQQQHSPVLPECASSFSVAPATYNLPCRRLVMDSQPERMPQGRDLCVCSLVHPAPQP